MEEIRQRRFHDINEISIEYIIYESIDQQWTQCFIQYHSYLAIIINHILELSRFTETSFEIIEN